MFDGFRRNYARQPSIITSSRVITTATLIIVIVVIVVKFYFFPPPPPFFSLFGSLFGRESSNPRKCNSIIILCTVSQSRSNMIEFSRCCLANYTVVYCPGYDIIRIYLLSLYHFKCSVTLLHTVFSNNDN